MEGIRRGWKLAGTSARIVLDEPKLVVFPTLSMLLIALAEAVIVVGARRMGWEVRSWQTFVLIAVMSYPLTFFGTFFGVAFVSMTRRSLDGEDVTAAAGLACAASRLGAIAGWSLLATAMALALALLQQARGGWLATRVATWLAGLAWAAATFFVLPVLALEAPGPIATVKRSAALVRRRFGETVSGTTYIASVLLAGFVLLAVLALAAGAVAAASPAAGIAAFAVFGVVALAGFSFFSALDQVLRLVLYRYATTGRAEGGFSEDELERSFRPRRSSRALGWLRGRRR